MKFSVMKLTTYTLYHWSMPSSYAQMLDTRESPDPFYVNGQMPDHWKPEYK